MAAARPTAIGAAKLEQRKKRLYAFGVANKIRQIEATIANLRLRSSRLLTVRAAPGRDTSAAAR